VTQPNAPVVKGELAESLLQEIFAQAPTFLAVLRGTEHIFQYVNTAGLRLVGDRELLGKPLVEALPEVSKQGLGTLLDSVLTEGVPVVAKETLVLLSHSSGNKPSQRYLDVICYPLLDINGTRSSVVIHGSDVTDYVLARRDAQRARVEAVQANQAKSQFLANMSHELRTPINAIVGYTELLELGIVGSVTERQKIHLERIRLSSQHLLMLIRDILDLAKMEAGRIEMEHERVLVVHTVATALALVSPQAEQREIQIETPCADDADITYVGDQDRVRQILANLLSNAIKFTAHGGTVRILCGTSSPPAGTEISETGPLTYIRVTDTGIGISPEALETIFQPFVQVEHGHTRTHSGTGLGLTISRHLARLMDGDLTVESQPGHGSTFTLWLPNTPLYALDDAVLEQTQQRYLPHLAVIGKALQKQIPAVLDRYMERLRHDPHTPLAARMSEVDLEDHASSFLADIAQSLIVLEDSPTAPERLLHDGSEIQRVIAELHGRQRAQFGWTAESLARGWKILREEIEAVARDAVSPESAGNEARELLVRFLERAEQISRRSLRYASVMR